MSDTNIEILPYAAAARRLTRSRRWTYEAVKTGLLDKAILPGRQRAMGVTAASVERLLRQCAGQQFAKQSEGGQT